MSFDAPRAMPHKLELEMLPQPDDTTCGPTCLHAVYRFHDDELPLDRVIKEVAPVETGGTLAVLLACHALRKGYRAKLYTYNLQIYDPSWFDPATGAPRVDLADKLATQMRVKSDPRLQFASNAYLEYLALGGEIGFRELSPRLLREYLNRNIPLLTGLSATYLYDCPREHNDEYNDIEGEPCGHFVVLSGYDKNGRQVLVADPHRENPKFDSHYYWVNINRLIGAIFLGILTYDGNLLALEPPARR
jgi:hypothetical protein